MNKREKMLCLHENLSALLQQIDPLFSVPVKVTLVVRIPTLGPEGELVIGDDDLDEVLAVVTRRRDADYSKGGYVGQGL